MSGDVSGGIGCYIADYAPVDRRGEVLGIYQTCSVVSMAVFPAAGIWILQHTQKLSFFVQRDFCYGISMLFRVTAAQGNESCL